MTESMDFDDIVESSFHCEDSLLMEEDALSAAHFFSELADVSFHEGDSLIRDLQVDSLNESFIDQYGAGQNDDFDIRVLGEKKLKSMGAVEVQYKLMFRHDLF